MKQLLFLVVLVALTGVSIVARHALSGDASAARTLQPAPTTAEVLRPAPARPIVAAAVEIPEEPSELQLAHRAAEAGTRLLQQDPTDPRKLRSAQAHFRACLAYESLAPQGTALFAEVRLKLQQTEKLLAQAAQPRTLHAPRELIEQPPTPPPPVVVAARPAPAPEPIMVGPDGIVFRRANSP